MNSARLNEMEKFYTDENAVERSKSYVGMNMADIAEHEKEDFDKRKPEIDAAHDKWLESRKGMLTVQRLIDFLKTQDPDACILAYEPNSDAYIEQFPSLPSPDVLNVKMAKEQMKEDLKSWYRDTPDADSKIAREISTVFRYAQDNDVIIRFS